MSMADLAILAVFLFIVFITNAKRLFSRQDFMTNLMTVYSTLFVAAVRVC
ncbi:hypothetical protein HY991_00080 [Candidatus Micrarchaeota archaeon]|nr:hypothetical protein [Candidatus Micrarchaeota archaeon]